MNLTFFSFIVGNKKWLETHMWHSKRMKMIEIWQYKLVIVTSAYHKIYSIPNNRIILY